MLEASLNMLQNITSFSMPHLLVDFIAKGFKPMISENPAFYEWPMSVDYMGSYALSDL